ncbi:unnamed protein product, partial [Heterosigma akashiwo]
GEGGLPEEAAQAAPGRLRGAAAGPALRGAEPALPPHRGRPRLGAPHGQAGGLHPGQAADRAQGRAAGR